MSRVDPQVRAAVIDRLREARAAGSLTSADVRRVAADVGVDERTVWRWLAGADDPARRETRGYQLTERDIAAFHDRRGNVAAVWRALVAKGSPGLPSLATLQRAFATQLTPGQRAAARDGVEGRRRHEVYLRWAPTARNALWEGDHVELPVLVLAQRAQRPVKPWATLFIDGFSRLITGWAVSLRPSSATVLAALRQGMVVDPERGPFGGLPEVLRPDNGLEFAAGAIPAFVRGIGDRAAPDAGVSGLQQGQGGGGQRDLGTGVPVRAAVLYPRPARR